MTKIVIVEDEQGLQTILKYNLEKDGYQTIPVMDGKKALETILKEEPDLILLDWMLPHVSGVEICKTVRQNHDIRHIPVLMLTARGDEADKVSGLSIGADDYMTKPFSVPELMARIKALLRRAPPKPPKKTKIFADLTVDFDKKQVMRGNRMVHIGPTEFRLLQIFLEEPERVFSRLELLKKVWGDAIYVEDRTVDVHVKRLRQALNAGGEYDIIRTVRSSGYALSEMKKK
ncbi:MAG: phosphate regulon transcriptional regulator PhoB [Alphaproteobacteria bacterium]|nr:phosphate regulon transcriptional regulator PhoB [Alphaproteobacteria bacterium]